MTRPTFKKISFFFIAMILFSVLWLSTAYATLSPLTPPPSGGYNTGTDSILDPGCGPTDTDCFVKIPRSQWDDVTGGINYAGGYVGIGTTTPTTALDVVGGLNVTTPSGLGNISLPSDGTSIGMSTGNLDGNNIPQTTFFNLNAGEEGGFNILANNNDTNNIPFGIAFHPSDFDGLLLGDVYQQNNGTRLSIQDTQQAFIFEHGTVGIGTTSPNPSTALDVSGNAVFNATPSSNAFQIFTDGTNMLTVDGADYKILLAPDAGNVGIGTTSPLGKLQVEGGSIYADAPMSDTVINGGAGSDWQVHANLVGSAGYWAMRTATDHSLNFDTYNSGSPLAALTIAENGNVGINGINQFTKLYIAGQNPNNFARILGGDSSVGQNTFQVHLHDNSTDQFGDIDVYASPEESYNVTAQNSDATTNTGFHLSGNGGGMLWMDASNSLSGSSSEFSFDPQTAQISNQWGRQFSIDDSGAGSITQIGDVSGNGYNNRITIDDRLGTINIGHNETSGPDGIEGIQIFQNGGSPNVIIGSTALTGHGTNILVADAAQSISFNFAGGSYAFPNTDGSNGQVLKTNGAGQLAWATDSGIPPISVGPSGDTLYSSGLANTYSGGTNNIILGNNAGQNAVNISDSANMFGYQAGYGVDNVYNANYFGYQTGYGVVDGHDANYFGYKAGYDAQQSSGANFFGYQAGYGASQGLDSNFFGFNAGYNAINSFESNFFGTEAGKNANNATNSNFFGYQAGYGSTANWANFLGYQAGYGTNSDAGGMVAIGYQAGYQSIEGNSSVFIGYNAGTGATFAANGNFIGQSAGQGAIHSDNSSFIGYNAGAYNISASGLGTPNAAHSIFIGNNAGYFAADNGLNNTLFADDYSILLGNNTSTGGFKNSIAIGANATNTAVNQLVIGSATRKLNSIFIGGAQGTASIAFTTFIGWRAGQDATNANHSNFLGSSAGTGATNASGSNFFGYRSAESAINANDSNFFGEQAGQAATNASNSNFFGHQAGNSATNSANSFFAGLNAGAYNISTSGLGTPNAAHSIFIGTNAGYFSADNGLDNTGNADDYSILLGNNTSTGGYENSIAMGANATNTASNQFMIGSATRPINTLVITGASGNTCILDVTVASPSCSSDERLKTNIVPLGDSTLETLMNVKTVAYNWVNFESKGRQIGFLAQDLQQYFPEVVSDAPNGYKTVSYGGMTPILVEAIREMNLNVTMLSDTTRPNTWRDALIAWFESTTNGIRSLVVHDKICVDDQCLTKDDIKTLLEMKNANTAAVVPQNNTTPTVDSGTTTTDNSGTTDTTSVPADTTGSTGDTTLTPVPDPIPVTDPVPTLNPVVDSGTTTQ